VKTSSQGLSIVVLSFCGSEIFLQINDCSWWLELFSDTECQAPVCSFCLIGERTEVMRMPDQVKFECGTADDVEEV
jgi:hypothetical protein